MHTSTLLRTLLVLRMSHTGDNRLTNTTSVWGALLSCKNPFLTKFIILKAGIYNVKDQIWATCKKGSYITFTNRANFIIIKDYNQWCSEGTWRLGYKFFWPPPNIFIKTVYKFFPQILSDFFAQPKSKAQICSKFVSLSSDLLMRG